MGQNQENMLYLVPTPIGNLEDMTYRSVRILKEVDYILAEDTRSSRPLLQHYAIDQPLYAHHAHNEQESSLQVVTDLKAGKSVALISDAGTPGISDPGFYLLRACVAEGLAVSCLPGASAVIPALVGAGLACDRFHFEGFLPHKKGRQSRLDYLADLPNTFALYESPHRLEKCLQQLAKVCGEERQAVVCRELSKKFESFHRGNLSELQAFFKAHPDKVRGEIVIVVEGQTEKKKKKDKYAKFKKAPKRPELD
ncbi:16S rRNA (cytidine(1402)-2'-O)-methyltransferase [Saprospira grandis]|nr:16S rRNA (cytidine(1402)-2'-O)-methyltransferase [Saprospira grandis]WBM75290.1 16S rRNA (cytidine(1402)-2'-O)-methyltransferase [Saprospira grandis]